ncbi:helix-turn-helix transcriptional regulator [Streptomyces sp. TX20-6-3]|uniref:helix-turn-helix domain-containing protein n=1 Tax=Streptomyces sp. TX20-6-3 TaxID=3028705 RepID=UPI0029B20D23|nr:helix-turn-helix transcriptional regulator [Streptomyces sp. TX20-6-3]MDX2559249.1 helix-turn-helix transcriptional regulator [Streptomyces sp. TX20-6-3]
MTPGRHTPDPREARTPAEFLARLQALKDWSGLTYRELAARAEAHGDVLPRSTVANMLARATLPREELLTAFVRACGVTPAELEEWRTVRTELARRGAYGAAEADADSEAGSDADSDAESDSGPGAPADPAAVGAAAVGAAAPDPAAAGAAAPDPAEAVGPPPAWPGPETAAAAAAESRGGASGTPSGPPRDTSSRVRRALVATVAVAGLVLAGVSVVALLRDGGTGPAGQPPRTPVAVAPAVGDVRIRVTGTDFCLAERRGTRTGQVHQVPCAESGFPLYSLATVGTGRWRIVSDHPDFGPGCSGIPSGGRIPDSAYEDSECGDPSRVEAFALEPYGTPRGPVRGYRIVPVGSATPGTCVTVVGDRAAAWAKLAQAPCAPDAAGQLFSFERRD